MKSAQLYLTLLACAAAIGFVGWFVVNTWHPLVPLPEELAMLVQPTQEQLEEKTSYERWNDSFALGLLSELFLLCGTPVLLAGSNPIGKRLLAIVLAGVLGIPVGIGAAWLGFYCQDWLPIGMDVLVRVAVRWIAVLAPIGLVAGVLATLAYPASLAGKLITGGIVGAMMAALVYCLVAAMLFQTENTDAMVPASPNARLLLMFTSPFLIWVFIAYQLRGHGVAMAGDTAEAAHLSA